MNSAELDDKKESSGQVPSLQMIRGLKVSTKFKKSTVEEILDFTPQDGDIIIASYPKTGTNWMSYIVHQILTKGESFPSFKDMMGIIPFLEMTGIDAVNKLATKPRTYKHHFPFNMVKKNPKAKVVYTYRRPEDTFVSYYYFVKNLSPQHSIDFDQYFEDFLSGNISYGRYFEHVLSYLEYKNHKNVLLVSYEKLKTQTEEEILRLAKFLGEEYYNVFVNNEALMKKVIKQTSFNFMKSNLCSEDAPTNTFLPKEEYFFRKGIIGDGNNALTEIQLQRLTELTNKIMRGTDILVEWMQK